MYITFGTRPYGTCDVIPELFYVGTWFFHVNYVPLFPTQTNLVLGRVGEDYRVIRIPMSAKSVFLAWFRSASFLGMVIFGIMFLIALNDRNGDTDALGLFTLALFSATCYAFFMIYPRKKMPSYRRACQLAEFAGLNDTGWAALNVLYGRDPFERPVKPGETIPMR